jgi:AcrR family transcriptional regulator
MPPRRPRVKTAYHHGNLREDLVTAALEIITHKGAAALTLRRVAKRLGVSQTAPYRHFASKEALLAAVAGQGFAALLTRMQAEVGAAAGPLARYQAICVAYVGFALDHPAHFQVMYASRPEDFDVLPSADPGRSAFRLLIELIVACQQGGLAAPGDPTRVAVEVWAFVHGLATLYLHGLLPHRMERAELRRLAHHTTVFLRGK